MRTPRTLLLALMLAAVLVAGLVGVAAVSRSAGHDVVRRQAALPTGVRAHSATAHGLRVLRSWDQLRARAWAHDDAKALRRLYVPGSRAGARDVHALLRWRARGLRVTGLHQQVFAARVERRSPDRLVLVVTDRVVDAVAAGSGSRVALPGDGWSTHRIDLRRLRGRWLVAAVRREGQPAR